MSVAGDLGFADRFTALLGYGEDLPLGYGEDLPLGYGEDLPLGYGEDLPLDAGARNGCSAALLATKA